METLHTNPAFDSAIKKMEKLLKAIEQAVAEQLQTVAVALDNMDVMRAKAVRRKDAEINDMKRQVEDQVLAVLAKHQPVAEDLRRAVGALKMSIELERAGDYVKHLANDIRKIAGCDYEPEIIGKIRALLGEVSEMFREFSAARESGDVDRAVRVWLVDQKVDDMCSDIVRDAFEHQKRAGGDVYGLVSAVGMAKNIERAGDKIKNLIEIYYYQKTGADLNINP